MQQPHSSVRWRAGLVLLVAAGVAHLADHAQAEPAGIHVSGTGEVLVVPDLARINLEVRREGPDAVELKRELDQVTAAVLGFVRQLAIAERDITAAAVHIHPRYRHREGETVLDGLIATRSIEITIRALDQLGEVINGALARGVNGVGSVRLDANDRPALEQAALDLAIDDALRQARQIAARFGVGLGPLLNAGSDRPSPAPMYMDAMVARSAPTESFAPGELGIRREIRATFAIEPAPTGP